MEYIIGDSSFKASDIMIPTFKKPFNAELNPQQALFNAKIAKICIRSEHCIGMLKGRFQYLKEMWILIKDWKSMIQVI
jgi:hypothetical protein